MTYSCEIKKEISTHSSCKIYGNIDLLYMKLNARKKCTEGGTGK